MEKTIFCCNALTLGSDVKIYERYENSTIVSLFSLIVHTWSSVLNLFFHLPNGFCFHQFLSCPHLWYYYHQKVLAVMLSGFHWFWFKSPCQNFNLNRLFLFHWSCFGISCLVLTQYCSDKNSFPLSPNLHCPI